MNNLVIGNTSQLSYFFPNDYLKISSRNIDFNFLRSRQWDSVYLCFGESNKFIDDITQYDKINFDLTIKIIESIKNVSKKIITYSTCELWNKNSGSIKLSDDFNFYETPYLISKYKLTEFIIENYDNVHIMFPFNFNSTKRKKNFLFGKIFDSIINKKKIEIGNTYFYRDLVHPKFVVQESINSISHKMIGSGRLTFVNDFIRDLYYHYDLSYDDLVTENYVIGKEYEIIYEYYFDSKKNNYTYTSLLTDTIIEINSITNK